MFYGFHFSTFFLCITNYQIKDFSKKYYKSDLFLLFSDFDQLPHNIPVNAAIADIEEKKGFIDYYVSLNNKHFPEPKALRQTSHACIFLRPSCPCSSSGSCLSNVAFCYLFLSQRFVIEVKTKGGSRYLIYRRYREFFNLHQILESKYSPEIPDRTGPNTCVLPSLPGEFLFKALIITDESNHEKMLLCHLPHFSMCSSESCNFVFNPLKTGLNEKSQTSKSSNF